MPVSESVAIRTVEPVLSPLTFTVVDVKPPVAAEGVDDTISAIFGFNILHVTSLVVVVDVLNNENTVADEVAVTSASSVG